MPLPRRRQSPTWLLAMCWVALDRLPPGSGSKFSRKKRTLNSNSPRISLSSKELNWTQLLRVGAVPAMTSLLIWNSPPPSPPPHQAFRLSQMLFIHFVFLGGGSVAVCAAVLPSRGLHTFSKKGQMIKSLGFLGHEFSVTTIQLFPWQQTQPWRMVN